MAKTNLSVDAADLTSRITRTPFPGSRKIYIEGSRPDIRVPFREVTLTPDHDTGAIAFRVTNVGGFGVLTTRYPAAQVTNRLLDELAKKLVGQPSRFG